MHRAAIVASSKIGKHTTYVPICCIFIFLAGTVSAGPAMAQTSSQAAPAVTSVTVSCPVAVPVNRTTQCKAVVQGTGNYSQSVTWSLTSIHGGRGEFGTIDGSGKYTAPETVPTPYTVMITATSTVNTEILGSAPVIIAGQIYSATQRVTLKGGVIKLDDGSSVFIEPGVLSSDRDVTLQEVSFLPRQPNNRDITAVGPALVLRFQQPVDFVTSEFDRSSKEVSQRISDSPAAIQFVIETGNNNVNKLAGSLPAADFVNPSDDHFFTGASGGVSPDLKEETIIIRFAFLDRLQEKVKSIAVSATNLARNLDYMIPEPGRFQLAHNADAYRWTDYSSCPAGKTLVVVHGMTSRVQGAFSTEDQTIQHVKEQGAYKSVVGFNYNWTRHIDDSGQHLAAFLDVLAGCPEISELDVEAHSEGVPVSMYAIGHSKAKVTRFIGLGGPIMGTPIANDPDLVYTFLLGVSGLDLPESSIFATIAPLMKLPFIGDLRPSTPGSGDLLGQIRNALSPWSHKNQSRIILIAGDSPREFWLRQLGKYAGTYSDGIIPLKSALAFGSGFDSLLVHPLFPYAVGHTDLESFPIIQRDAGVEISTTSPVPALTFVSSSQCTHELVCSKPLGARFELDGSAFSSPSNVRWFEQYPDGNVMPVPTISPNVGSTTLQTSIDCSTKTAVFFAADSATGLHSNALTEQVEGSCQ